MTGLTRPSSRQITHLGETVESKLNHYYGSLESDPATRPDYTETNVTTVTLPNPTAGNEKFEFIILDRLPISPETSAFAHNLALDAGSEWIYRTCIHGTQRIYNHHAHEVLDA